MDRGKEGRERRRKQKKESKSKGEIEGGGRNWGKETENGGYRSTVRKGRKRRREGKRKGWRGR